MQIIQLDTQTSPYFANLTFPEYRHLLTEYDAAQYTALGALTDDGLPIGLILVGNSTQATMPHEILSIYVDDEYRNQGVATKMLTNLRELVSTMDVDFVKGDYPDDLPDVMMLEAAFASGGFVRSKNELLTLRGAIRIGMELVPNVIDLPEGMVFRDWASRTPNDDQQIIAYLENHEDTGAHNPFYNVGVPVHDATSILLCHGEQVLGWMVTHEIEVDAIRYSRLFIAPDWRKQRLGVRCFFESMRRHYAHNPDSDAIFAVESYNTPMLAVIEYFKGHEVAHFSRVKRMFWRKAGEKK